VARKYKILLEKRAVKQLGELNEDVRVRIVDVLRMFRDEGFSAKLDLKKLRGYKNHYRITRWKVSRDGISSPCSIGASNILKPLVMVIVLPNICATG